MRVSNRKRTEVTEIDMTPMIDMTFQLIAFFMVIINFTETEQNQAIQLPLSELAKPPDKPISDLLTLQITRPDATGQFAGKSWVYLSGYKASAEPPFDQIRGKLQVEKQLLEVNNKSPADATIILRGDQFAKTGVVQRLIEVCQELGFVNFALRARQEREKVQP